MSIQRLLAIALLGAVASCGEAGEAGDAPPGDASRSGSTDTPTPGPAAPGPGPEGSGADRAGAGADGSPLGSQLDVDLVCDTISNTFRCARAIERRQLPGASAALRRGDTLLLAPLAADTIRLVDDRGDAADVVHYSYQDHWPGPGLLVVQTQYYEGSEFLLVDDSTGARTRVPDRPLPAPDGRRFAVLSLDLVAGYGPNALQVWSLAGHAPELEWETEPGQWGPTDGRWAGPTTLEFIQHGYCSELGGAGRTLCDQNATLRQVGDDWHLEPGRADGS